jgi:hypothetical protein
MIHWAKNEHGRDHDVKKYRWMAMLVVSGTLLLGCDGKARVDPVTKEIDAAARLNMDHDKSVELVKIARQAGLTPDVQVHLVDVTFDDMVYDDERMNVLTALIANREFSRAAKAKILDRIGEFTSMDAQKEVLFALDRRGEPTR